MNISLTDQQKLEDAKKRAQNSDGYMMIDLKFRPNGELNIHPELNIRDQFKSMPYIYEGIFTGIIMMLLNKLIEEGPENEAKVTSLTQIENLIKMSKLGLGSTIKVVN